MSKARKPRTRTRPATRNGPAIPASEAGPVPAEPRAELAWGEDAAARVLRVLAERLESFLEGDELAFETLGERLEDEGFSGDDLEAAILALRRGGAPAAGAFESAAESLEAKRQCRGDRGRRRSGWSGRIRSPGSSA